MGNEISKSIKILNCFENFFNKRNYEFLNEKPLLRDESAETFFIMSAIAANISLFDNLATSDKAKYWCKQRVFFGNKLDGVGITPLANPLETSLSLFHMKELSLDSTIESIFSFLNQVGISTSSLLIRSADNKHLIDTFLRHGIHKDNLFVWKNLAPFRIGDSRPKGFYSYPYVKYKHGIIPLGSISYIPYAGYWFTDTAIFQERIVMILEEANSIYNTSIFREIVNSVDSLTLSDNRFVNYRLVAFFRTIAYLSADGLTKTSGSGPGHVLKRLLREIGYLLEGKTLSIDEIKKIFNSIYFSVEKQKYNINIDDGNLYYLLNNINRYSVNIMEEISIISKLPIDIIISNKKRLIEEKGLRPEWIVNSSRISKEISDIFRPYIRERDSIRNKAFTFDSLEAVNTTLVLSESI